MFLMRLPSIVSLLALIVLPAADVQAQKCDPCESHCALLGGTANAACVKSGVDPIVCGGGKPKLVTPQNRSVTALDAPSVLSAGPPCTTQGICYREGIAVKNSCLASCFICTPSTVHPDFLLISILYAAPGNASSASFGQ